MTQKYLKLTKFMTNDLNQDGKWIISLINSD